MLQQALHGQRNDVARALTQGQQTHAEGGDAVIQVLAELALHNGFLEVFVGGRHDAHIQLDGGLTAQASELALLQHAQQFALQVHGHFADFIQKQGAALGLLEQAFLFAVGASEGPFVMTKQHVFDQVVWHGRAVECHKGATGSARSFVQHTRQHFFARTRGAHQQGRNVGLCDSFGQSQQVLTGRIDKHHAAHGLNGGACRVGAQVVVQSQPRGGAHIVAGQHGHGATTARFHGQLQFMSVNACHHRQTQACLLQQLLHRLQSCHVHTQVQNHDGSIRRLRQQHVQRVDGHQSPAAVVQGLAVLGAQRCFRVQPKGQRGRCSSWLHRVASHFVSMCKATLVPVIYDV